MSYDYFLATRWRNRDEALRLIAGLKKRGKTVYSCFESEHNTERIKENPEKAMQEYEEIDNWRESNEIKAIFKTDMDGLKASDVLLMLLPAGKSAHIEAGVAYGLKKKCILIGEQKETESLYLIFDESYGSIEEFLTSLA